MTTDTTPKPVAGEVIPGDRAILTRLGEMSRELQPMIDAIPEAVSGDGEINIIEQIMAAQSIDQIDSPWEARSLEDSIGRKLTVTGLRKGKSDFTEGFDFYLLIDALDEQGNKVTLTTGSISCVVQLVRAHTLGALPATFVPVRAERPSANGFYPMHLALAR